MPMACFCRIKRSDFRFSVVLSGLWWGGQDLNLRPIGYEPTALTTELPPLVDTQAYRLTDVSIADLVYNQRVNVTKNKKLYKKSKLA